MTHASKRWRTALGAAALGTLAIAQAAADTYPRFDLRGRAHFDAAFHNEDRVDFSDRMQTRRIRLGVAGEVAAEWSFIIEYDFAGNDVSAQDVYLRRSLPIGRLTIGQMKVPQGLNELTGANSITFIERASPVVALANFRRLGFAYEAERGDLLFQSMAFGRAVGEEQPSGDDMPLGVAGRLVYAPRFAEERLFHAGASAVWENRRDRNAVRLSDRPESRPGNVRLADTAGVLDDVDAKYRFGLELAWQEGPFSAEAEYLSLHAERDDARDPVFSGYHVQASYVLTGESRGYRNGTFRGITPAPGLGAWEIAARFSSLDLSDSGVEGGEQRNITLGVNYYAAANIRFMFNYIFVDVRRSQAVRVLTDGERARDRPRIALLRAQYHF